MTTFGGQAVPPLFEPAGAAIDPDNPATWPAPVNLNPNIALQNFSADGQIFLANPFSSRANFIIRTVDFAPLGSMLRVFSTPTDAQDSNTAYQWAFPDNFFASMRWRVPVGGVYFQDTLVITNYSITDVWTTTAANTEFGSTNGTLGTLLARLEFDPNSDDMPEASCTFRLRKTA